LHQDIIYPPRSRRALLRGVDTIVDAIRPTLGPCPRLVAVMPTPGSSRPIELLDDGGLIARRIVALPDRDEDAGAMLVRHVAWCVRDRVGDGSATAAVLFRAVFAGAVRAIEAGADPGRLRAGLERGARVIGEELMRSARPVAGQKALGKIAAALCGDAELGAILGEVIAVVGVDGDVECRPALHRGIGRQYVAGTFWEGGLLARETRLSDAAGRVVMRDAAIAMTDLEIDALPDLLSFLDRARDADLHTLAIVARRISDRALGLLANGSSAGSARGQAAGQEGLRVIAVRTPGATPHEQFAALGDMALLCGGQPVVASAGQTLAALTPERLGRARRIWATAHHFGIAGGSGDPSLTALRIEELRRASAQAASVDERERLQRRLGKLQARTAVVTVGDASERAGKARRERARRTLIVLREALRRGLVPGGGAALLACRPRLAEERERSNAPDEHAAWTILLAAAEEPFRTIVANAGYDPERCLHRVSEAPPECGFDALRGEVVAMLPAGIADAVSVQQMALETAVSAAAVACTIGVLVHPRRREESALP
jgi:chaperonin GroEL